MRIRLTQLDGKLPNLALMKLSAWHRARGDEIVFTRNVQQDLWEREQPYDVVYGSVIFTRSAPTISAFRREWPNAILGGTGLAGADGWQTVEQHLGVPSFDECDYSIYPQFTASIGFTMRGCRLKCAFCVVPRKEGRPQAAGSIADIWRGSPLPKHVILLDNDFFGQPPQKYESVIAEILDGDFKVSFNQGINVRLLRKQEHADALARMKCRDTDFKTRCIYTAFDNADDEAVFRRGIEFLLTAGFKGRDIMVYMLIGFDQKETWERIMARWAVMNAYNLRVFPMVYEAIGPNAPPANRLNYRELKQFQRYIIRRFDRFVTFEQYKTTDPRRLHDAAKELDLFGMDPTADDEDAA